jgi:UDP-3-O-[3-hydroxymyristoyl] glucosamine N-acyltransferase
MGRGSNPIFQAGANHRARVLKESQFSEVFGNGRGHTEHAGTPTTKQQVEHYQEIDRALAYADRGIILWDCQIDPSAELGNECQIGEGSVISAGVKIGRGTVIGDNVEIGDWAEIDEMCIIGDGCNIGTRTTIGADTVLGCDVQIDDDVEIGEGCDIPTGVRIKSEAFLGNLVTLEEGQIVKTCELVEGEGYE